MRRFFLKAIILAAGEATRLGKAFEGKPKCLIDFNGSTLLEIQLNTLHGCGVDDIVVVRGYQADQIGLPGLRYYDNSDYSKTNMLYSLFCAEEELDEELIILYADILYEEEVVKRIMESSHDVAVGVMVNWAEAIKQRDKVALEKLEMVFFDSESRIEEISKRTTDDDRPQGQFVGIMKCSKRGAAILTYNYRRLSQISPGEPFGQAASYEMASLADLFQEMTYLGVPLHCVIIERGWMEIDTPEDYKRALVDNQFVHRLIRKKTDWNLRSKFYDRLDWVNRDELLSVIIEEAGDLCEKKILDLGTGTGKILKALQERCPDGEYHGIDISQGMLDKIDAKYGFDLHIGEIEDLSEFETDSFDLVTARMVFHHSKNLQKAMNEISRVLKPGGKFILCEGVPPNRISLPFYERMFWYKEDRLVFMIDDLINLLLDNKFDRVITRSVVYRGMSLNNWLENSGLPFRNVDIIRDLHLNSDPDVRQAYNMKFLEDDILMDWKFSVVTGIRRNRTKTGDDVVSQTT
ncbi:MAG TPA: methyltransferase domain-containing protein [bacterium]|nr:methyltransferase domain-containing protein [bacterium]